jgi:cytochrome c-type biogenesis protein CcmH/NrfG
MSEPAATEAGALQGKRIAFTGKLASLSRSSAAALVRAHGGEFAPLVTEHTSMLVVGQEGWPLRKDGRLTRKLEKAKALRQKRRLEILTEAELLRRLGLEQGFQKLTTAQVSEALRIPGKRVRSWVRLGLIRPIESADGVHYFDFREVAWAKTLCGFAEAGISANRIRRSLQQLRAWMPEAERPLAQLALLAKDGHLLVRRADDQLADPSGQLQLDFFAEPAPQTVPLAPDCQTAEEWFDLGCDHEDAGRFEEAVTAYRQALQLGGPDANRCFNLANVLFALGKLDAAAERFRQAVELDSGFSEAWNNLGNVLAELGERGEAVEAYQKALALEPDYADAHYNLADTLEQMGCQRDAVVHWRAYLQYDPNGPSADYARYRLFSAG